jgi:hypothetical protein
MRTSPVTYRGREAVAIRYNGLFDFIFMKTDIFKSRADSLTPLQRKRYHTVSECENKVKTKGHLLDFMDDVTETKLYSDGSGGKWSVFSWFCPDGWRHSSSMGVGPSVWETRSWPLVVKHLDRLANGIRRDILSNSQAQPPKVG